MTTDDGDDDRRRPASDPREAPRAGRTCPSPQRLRCTRGRRSPPSAGPPPAPPPGSGGRTAPRPRDCMRRAPPATTHTDAVVHKALRGHRRSAAVAQRVARSAGKIVLCSPGGPTLPLREDPAWRAGRNETLVEVGQSLPISAQIWPRWNSASIWSKQGTVVQPTSVGVNKQWGSKWP